MVRVKGRKEELAFQKISISWKLRSMLLELEDEEVSILSVELSLMGSGMLEVRLSRLRLSGRMLSVANSSMIWQKFVN